MELRTSSLSTLSSEIPSQWDEVPIGEVFHVLTAASKSPFVESGGKYLIADMGSVSRDAKLICSKRTNLELDVLQDGDLVMPKDDIGGGHIIGKVGHIDSDDQFVLGDHVFGLRAQSGNALFLSYAINSRQVNADLKSKVTGSAQLGLSRKSVINQLIPFPPLVEQRTIAEALSDVDALIEALDALIGKKRDIKSAAMQQLLTGRTRLPGFSEEWDEVRLGSHLRFQVGFPFSSNHFNTGGRGVRLIKNRDLKADDQITHFDGPFSDEYRVSAGDVLVGMDGDFSTCLWSGRDALLNQRVGRLLASRTLDSLFAYYALAGPLKDIEDVTSSTTVKHLSHGDVAKITFALPEIEEQEAIATFLSDMDAEIEALRARRDKTAAIKTGMMQELLTGRTRLV